MSNFIEVADYEPQIRSYNLDDLIDESSTLLDMAEETAIQIVKDHIYNLYDVDAIFSQTGSARHRGVLQLCVNIVLYLIFQRLADVMIPEMVKDNYKEAMTMLKSIAAGNTGLQGAQEATDGDGNSVTVFQWGSKPRRY